jgi:DNA-binding NarL/FixJ family response regulator
MIRVLIAEDQAMVLGALAALLAIERDIDVVATVQNGRTALAETIAKRPDVVLTDIEMPEMGGLELAGELKRIGAPAFRGSRSLPFRTSSIESVSVRATAVFAVTTGDVSLRNDATTTTCASSQSARSDRNRRGGSTMMDVRFG